MKFNKVSADLFEKLQFNAGMVLKTFDPENPATPQDADIVCATTGGVNANCVPSYIDMGEDVDNVPNGTMELMEIDAWDCKLSFTALDLTEDMLLLSLGCAKTESGKIVPKMKLETSMFKTLWWVGEITGGGWCAIKLENALSSGGFSLKTQKKGKGTLSVELTGHPSINDQETVPMSFYFAGASAE